jgi:hypothetical protein
MVRNFTDGQVRNSSALSLFLFFALTFALMWLLF